MHTFIANNIEILRFSPIPDTSGSIIPANAYADFPNTISILYGREGYETKAGVASLRRQGNSILADMVIKSSMTDHSKALNLIRKLYPSVAFNAHEFHGKVILKLEIYELFLTAYSNDDTGILQLGNRVALKPKKKDLH